MQQESTTTHFTLGFICIFVNSDSPTGAAVYFSQKVSIYMTFDICGGIFIHLKFPHWIISYSTNLKWSENKHRSHENICSNECWESWCLHHKCLKSTWKLTFSLFLPKGGNLFAGSGKIRLVGWFGGLLSICPIRFSSHQRSEALQKQICHLIYQRHKLFGHFNFTSEKRNNLGGWPKKVVKLIWQDLLDPRDDGNKSLKLTEIKKEILEHVWLALKQI